MQYNKYLQGKCRAVSSVHYSLFYKVHHNITSVYCTCLRYILVDQSQILVGRLIWNSIKIRQILLSSVFN